MENMPGNRKPSVSFIVPVYNAVAHLRATLDSIIAQSYTKWEMLCVNDGSTDCSPQILADYASLDSKIKVINTQNAGPGAARNCGLDMAQGEYVVFQDCDDLLHPEMLRRLLDVAEEQYADVVICGFKSCSEDATDIQWDNNISTNKVIYKGDLPKAFEDATRFRGHPWGKLYRRSTIGDIKFTDLRSGEDTFFNIDIAVRSQCMVIVPDELYMYRQASQSLTHQAQHHENSITAGNAISLHCLELFQHKKISANAALLLIRRYGTNCILLHLLLMMDNYSVISAKRHELLKIAAKNIKDIQAAWPMASSVISSKYRLVYYLAIQFQSLTSLSCFCRLRKCMLTMIIRH